MLIGRVLTVLSLVAMLIFSSASSAVDNESTRATLKGLAGVRVLVEDFDEVRKRAGFDARTFQTDVESKLRMAGIKVLSREEGSETPGRPWLYVWVRTLHVSPNEIAPSSILFALNQMALLQRDPSVETVATTWSISNLGEGRMPSARDLVKAGTDIFINAWLSVNPKKGLESTE